MYIELTMLDRLKYVQLSLETVPGDKSMTETMVGMRKDLILCDVTVLTAMFEV
jgi:hypothetical protein